MIAPRHPQPPAGPAMPTQASPARRLFHLGVAIGGWALFLWWWWIVLGRLDPAHVRFTVYFILGTLFGCVLLTAAWAFHNLRIFRRKGPRTQVTRTDYVFERDRLGRALSFESARERIESAPVVDIRLSRDGKTYRALERLDGHRRDDSDAAVRTAQARR